MAKGHAYSPAIRLQTLREILNSTGGATIADIAERLDVTTRTVIRYLRALEASGVPLYEDRETGSRATVWRIMPSARQGAVTLSTTQMLALALGRRVFSFLDGTGFAEDLNELFDRLEATLRRQEFAVARNLDRKLWDRNEAPHRYEGRIDDLNDIVTALLREERLRVRHGSVGKWSTPFVLEPYSLIVFRKGLYLVGFSHHHQGIRTFSLDGMREIEWLKGDRFEYPAEDAYHPQQLADGAWGIITGPETRIRIRFSKKVARYIRRRQWHSTQKITELPGGGCEIEATVAGTTEIVPWVLEWGAEAEVLEPQSLRDEIAQELKGALAKYERPT